MRLAALNLFLALSCFYAHADQDLTSTCPWNDRSVGALTPTLEEISRQSELPMAFLKANLVETNPEFLEQHFPPQVRKNEPNLLVDGSDSSLAINLVRILLDHASLNDEFSRLQKGQDTHRELTTDEMGIKSAMGLVRHGNDIVHVSCVRIATAVDAFRFNVLNPCSQIMRPLTDGKFVSTKKILGYRTERGNYACYVQQSMI